MPICVYDIAEDGTATIPDDSAPTGPAAFRWWHFDRNDPAFREWVSANLPAIPAGALLQAETRPRCDPYEDGLIVNLRGVNLNADSSADQMVAVRMWIARGIVITVRVRRVFALEDIRERIKAGNAPRSPMAFLAELAAILMGRVQTTVFEAADRVDAIEEALEEDESALPQDLAIERRKVIRLRRYIGPQRDALNRLATIDSPLLDRHQRHRLRESANQAVLSYEELDALVGRLAAVADHHAIRSVAEQSRNGYVLSIVAVIFLPLGFFTGLFGVNLAGMPGLHEPRAFWLLCAGLVVVTAAMIILLRRIRLM